MTDRLPMGAAVGASSGEPNLAAPAFQPYRDLAAALIDGAVTVIAVIVASAFWILSAWPSGPTAVTFTAIICAITGGRDDPGVVSINFP